MSRHRVFVTGIGWITPHGDDVGTGFAQLCAGQPAIRREVVPSVGGQETVALLARAVWQPDGSVTPLQKLAMDPVAQMGVAAGARALTAAGLERNDPYLPTAGLYIGCGLGGVGTLEESFERYFGRQIRRTKPTTVPRVMPNATAAHLAMIYGMRGPSHTYSVACASSAASVGEGFRAIRDGYLDCVVAGGAEAMISDGNLASWEAAGVLAREHADGPGASVRPFDRERSGFVLGEGAAMLVLESETRMRQRGRTPVAELVGYGASTDAMHLTQPHADGQVRAIRAALADARLNPDAIGYVNAHATATPVGDLVEVEALKAAFGDHARRLAISATKSMHGHLIGAAGALELAITCLALQHQQLPPTANLDTPDTGCDLDFIPREGRTVQGLDYAISNAFAFGGSNVSLVLRRAPT